ncbi:uncharacterized protein LOC144161027 [Haemaphysalis longicornis]
MSIGPHRSDRFSTHCQGTPQGVTDSQSACRRYATGRINRMSSNILARLSSLPTTRIVWISGHTSFPGNEVAQATVCELTYLAFPEEDYDIRHFDDYRYASGLNERFEEAQLRTLLYNVGRQARDIFVTFHLSAEDSKKFDLVKKKFNEYFIKETNVVYESACFHKRHQMLGESIDVFMTALHVLAEKCDFGEFKQRLMPDRFVVGLRDEKLSESLQMNPKQSLATALAKARLKETVRQQPAELRSSKKVRGNTPCKPCDNGNVDAVGHRTKPHRSEDTRPPAVRSERQCIFCGGHSYLRTDCPAREQKCFNCGTKAHFGKVCLKGTSPSNQRKVAVSFVQKDNGEIYGPWRLAPRPVTFRYW